MQLITVTQAAVELGIRAASVRKRCIAHAIGVKVNERTRLLSPADVRRLRKLVTGSHRRGPKPKGKL